MAINPDTSLPNRNTLYLACSGGGKSQAVMQNRAIPGRGVRVLLWDIDHDHTALHLSTLPELFRAVKAGIRSGRGFRLAFDGDDTPANFEKFCALAWACLDGKRPTYIIIEELADVVVTASKAGPEFGRLLRKCRKFNGLLHITTQRGAEIPKTAYTQCPTKYIGQQEGEDVERMARIAGVTPAQVKALKPLEFYIKEAGAGDASKKRLRFRPKKSPPQRRSSGPP